MCRSAFQCTDTLVVADMPSRAYADAKYADL
jgi:hypothetical protein